MPGRPKNPPADRRQEILEGALRVFGRKGYAAATNADIAREAGVTAAALYHYFPSKADLFKAALTERTALLFPMLEEVRQQLMSVPPDVVLPLVVENMCRFMSDERTLALISIFLSEAPRDPELVELWQSQIVGPGSEVLLGYTRDQMERGRLRPMDPRVLFLIVAGPILMSAIMKDIARIPLLEGFSYDELVGKLNELVMPAVLEPGAAPPPAVVRQKVLAYITRERNGRTELLVFDHVDFPDAGTQVPAGSIDPGESPDQAVVREALEEVGVEGLRIVSYLGCHPFQVPEGEALHMRHVYHLTTDRQLPDSWIHVVSAGVGDKGMRFRCFWMAPADAVSALSGAQGAYLRPLLEQA